ncbi:thioredoxin domain-containing protein [Streptomyces sp. AJS327]|uniref:thioredoxin domain-containing protein n=1 Tax=Streptomyces sp. AJS327 TaxID=2545265 RepID=UPI0015DDEA1D|nr:thioredoxin domain-containing protein [Streptomyces sp. AJS327]MBA0051290.1 thioredoxin domain-containing protein [Streptomyces sp. AJS327]
MNRLADATSPYLQQHADNPVDWWPWSDEAFEEARRRDVPVLLSVGYSACHWCHVMADESFADVETARLLNENFVSVKVDREERPDVDAVYMEAVQAATGHGGWPMTVFLTPEAEPFYFGTYFPPRPRHGMPSFGEVLEGVRLAWAERREEVADVAARITRDLASRALRYDGAGVPGPDETGAALLGLTRDFDAVRGGFGDAPKFPPSMVLEFLLRQHARTGSEGALQMVEATCEAMARGGLYDQLGGGFARYSVDAEWVVPHFERMLYDNALLCRVYAHLWRTSGSAFARRIALETADFLVGELGTAQGGFASALDADSDDGTGRHREGAYYVWTPAQLVEALGERDAAYAADRFRVTAEGSFEEGASVLQLPALDGENEGGGENVGPGGGADGERLESVRARLREARAARARPARDEKVVAAWNGLAIAALAETGQYFDRPDLVDAATRAAELLAAVHTVEPAPEEGRPHTRLLRTSRDGAAGPSAGVLEDYADVAEGYLTLFAVTGRTEWLTRTGALLETVLARFVGEDGTPYDTADDAERLIRRPQDPSDNAVPSGWTAAAAALLSYAAYTGSDRHRRAAERALAVVSPLAARVPRFIGWGLAAAEALLDGPREVAVVGPASDPGTELLHRTALLATAPGVVVARGEPEPGPGTPEEAGVEADAGAEVPLLGGRGLVDGRPAAYVCRGFVCSAPTTDADELAAALTPEEPSTLP